MIYLAVMTFTRIKIDKADKEFSRYIRLRSGKCEYCGKMGTGPEGIHGLEASHFFGRRRESVRYDSENVDCLCIFCHKGLGENPAIYAAWKLKQLGQEKFNALTIRANSFKKKDRAFELLKARELVKSLKREVA